MVSYSRNLNKIQKFSSKTSQKHCLCHAINYYVVSDLSLKLLQSWLSYTFCIKTRMNKINNLVTIQKQIKYV